jgi:hypothetical protein
MNKIIINRQYKDSEICYLFWDWGWGLIYTNTRDPVNKKNISVIMWILY